MNSKTAVLCGISIGIFFCLELLIPALGWLIVPLVISIIGFKKTFILVEANVTRQLPTIIAEFQGIFQNFPNLPNHIHTMNTQIATYFHVAPPIYDPPEFALWFFSSTTPINTIILLEFTLIASMLFDYFIATMWIKPKLRKIGVTNL